MRFVLELYAGLAGETKPARDQAVQTRRERHRIVRHLAIENLRLIEQYRREIGYVVLAGLRFRLRQGLDQRVAHVELEYRLAGGAASLTREQALELPIGPAAGRHQAHRTIGQTLRCAHVRDPLAD